MRGLASYLAAGILAVLAMDMVAPPVGLGLATGAVQKNLRVAPPQIVDRTHKGDRLFYAPTASGKRKSPVKAPTVMVGCDPVYSPLSASAQANSPGRCVA